MLNVKYVTSGLAFLAISGIGAQAQDNVSLTEDAVGVTTEVVDSLEGDTDKRLLKLTHAEPLYVDLIRDLGARKGEKEWNIGYGVTDGANYDRHDGLIEYEFAPVDRLGFEVELPFSFYNREPGVPEDGSHKAHWEGVKLATQYTFLVNKRYRTSMAIGYIQEFEMPAFANWRENPIVNGTIYNPFFVAAKQWGSNWHSLLYTGPMLLHDFEHGDLKVDYQINFSVHYMIPGSHNFIGIEMDSDNLEHDYEFVLRPQMKLKIAERTNLGFVFSMPIDRTENDYGGFIRLIYEPEGNGLF